VGTTWGPHALHAGRRPARGSVERTALATLLTRTDAYSHVLGSRGRRLTNDQAGPAASRGGVENEAGG
jgi:hypothetical protein